MADNTYKFDVEQTAIILFPERTPRVECEIAPRASIEEDYGISTVSIAPKSVSATFTLQLDGRVCRETARSVFAANMSEDERKTEIRHTIRRSVYKAYVNLTGAKPAWGALAGVRPAKLVRKLMEEGRTEAEVRRLLDTRYCIRRDKIDLAMTCAKESMALKSELHPKDAAVYAGIPFCPTRCAYCSFISKSASAAGAKEIETYLQTLIAEVEETGRQMAAADARVRAIYIGGGTPTTLNAEQLTRLIGAMKRSFAWVEGMEFTLEAGRPDTITREKLEAAAKGGVNRISINPQTFSNRVLGLAGRNHTVEDIYRVFEMAREFDEFAINMDLIAGLPGDSLAGFAGSVANACNLGADNITVHTLALKRGSALTESGVKQHSPETISGMLAAGEELLYKNGYAPYYLYRQKYSGGSFENVGYARDGAICRYNIYMMDELLPVVSCGAGAVTKLGFDGDGEVVRIANPKYPEDYIRRADEILANRAKIGEFYQNRLGIEMAEEAEETEETIV